MNPRKGRLAGLKYSVAAVVVAAAAAAAVVADYWCTSSEGYSTME